MIHCTDSNTSIQPVDCRTGNILMYDNGSIDRGGVSRSRRVPIGTRKTSRGGAGLGIPEPEGEIPFASAWVRLEEAVVEREYVDLLGAIRS